MNICRQWKTLSMVMLFVAFLTQPLEARMLSLHSKQLEGVRSRIDGVDRQGCALFMLNIWVRFDCRSGIR